MKLYKFAATAALLAAVTTSCSEGQYWDEPGNVPTVCAFPKTAATLNIPASDPIPSSYDVTITRNNAGGSVTVPVTFTSSSPLLSGPASITFSDGATSAAYTISIADGAKAGLTYSATISLEANEEMQLPDANRTFTFNLSKVLVLDWQPAGTAHTYSDWAGNEAPVAIPVEEAVNWPIDGERRMRLISPYWYLEPAYAEEGHNIEFLLTTEGNAKAMYQAWQYMGEINEGDYLFFGCPANYGGYFRNQGDVFVMNGIVGYAASMTGSVSPGWDETMQFQWTGYGK